MLVQLEYFLQTQEQLDHFLELTQEQLLERKPRQLEQEKQPQLEHLKKKRF